MNADFERLRLRALRTSDEHVFEAAQRELAAEGSGMGSTYQAGMQWDDFLKATSDNAIGVNLPAGWVPNTFLVADVDGTLVGSASVRHSLNDALRQYGGHIGYAVLPDKRRRGYGTAILRQCVRIAHTIGIDPVLVTCDEDNIGSIKAIEAVGGQLGARVQMPSRTVPTRHYWIG